MIERRGWLGVFVAAALCASPHRAAALDPPGEPAAAGDPGDPQVGGFAGWGAAATSGFALRADGELPSRALGTRLSLAWLGSLGLSRLTRRASGFGYTGTATVTLLQLVPGLRLSRSLGDRLSAYVDAGLGLYRAATSTRHVYAFGLGTTTTSSSEVAAMARLGAGLWVRAAPRLDVGAGLALEPHLGRFGETTVVLQAGAMYQL